MLNQRITKHAFSIGSAVAFTLVGAIPAQSWFRASTTGPIARDTHAMVFDPVSGRVLMHGGYSLWSTTQFADMWAWDGKTWKDLKTPGPTTRETFDLAFDGIGILMYGGASFCCSPRLRSDTWRYANSKWTKLLPKNVPPARRSHKMVSMGRSVLLFGGHAGGNPRKFYDDTWVWNGQDWTKQTPKVSPKARGGHALAWDPIRKRVVLFGGGDSAGPMADTWEWDGSDWTKMTPAKSPSAMIVGLVFDTKRQRTVLFGGYPTKGQTWEWDGSTWTQLTSTTTPGNRWAFPMVYDETRRQVVLFGGRDSGGSLGDTWVFPNIPASYTAFGKGCAGTSTPPSLKAPTLPRIGSAFSLEVGNLKPRSGGVIVIGDSDKSWNGASLPLDLAFLAMPGCKLLVSWILEVGFFSTTGGVHTWKGTLPNDPALLGATMFNQAWVLDAAANIRGIATSNGGKGIIGN